MITVSKEDYLKAILEAESEGENVISATLAHWLSVSAPAVTMAMRRLKRDGLVKVQVDGRVQLTGAGREIARRLTVRHHLIERMLHEIFGMEWTKVHEEAERLEHAVSADFEARLVKKLGRGGICPHGNQMTPESAASRKRRGLIQADAMRIKEDELLEKADAALRPQPRIATRRAGDRRARRSRAGRRWREMCAPPRKVCSVHAQPMMAPVVSPGARLRIRRFASIPV